MSKTVWMRLARLAAIALPLGMLALIAVGRRWEHPFLVGETLPLAWLRAAFFAPVTLFVVSDLLPLSLREWGATQAVDHPVMMMVATSALCALIWYRLAAFVWRGK